MVIEQIWDESRDYYLDYQTRIIGELLITPAGSIKRKKGRGVGFLYLHKRKGQKFEDVYLGGENDPAVQRIAEKINHRQRLIRELRSTKGALKLLKAGKMAQALKDFIEPLRKLFIEMEKLGFFEAGIELVGSYCFKVYQSHFGVEWFPLRTLDVDFAIPAPYKGPSADLEAVLKKLGFRQEFRSDGTIFYEGNGLIIEFLQPRKGSGAKGQLVKVKELSTNPIPLPYLNLLLDNKVEVSLRDIGRISLPSMPAFTLHKLLIASLPSRKQKKEKDLIQACAVARKIIMEENLMGEVHGLLKKMPASWRKKINNSALTISNYVADCRVDFSTFLTLP
ncbi:MAG: GSU2403 family nucleotidyltransferase fold protein [Deltaproteobacteria bacterium]|nr:GSU2403 family nucleotidyltransferase fold protein [Deltaproteobacteria bacterium]